MQTTIQQIHLYHGSQFALPDGFIVRAVVDQLGAHMAHVETMGHLTYRPFSVVAIATGPVHGQVFGAVPEGALYLGHVVEQYGTRVVHYYAVQA